MSGGALPSVLLAIDPTGQGDRTQSGVLWRYRRSLPLVPSPIVYRGALYLVKEGGILTALDAASGAFLKQVRLSGALDNYFASPVAAEGKLYLTSQAGHVVVVRAQRDLKILAVNDLDEECFATPAVAPGRLYIRTRNALWYFGESARANSNGGGRGYRRIVNNRTQ
jgi:outer membrane protein assembly factor BamB